MTRKYNFLIIYAFFLVFMVASTMADIGDGIFYYTFNTSLIDSGNRSNAFTLTDSNGGSHGEPSILDGSFYDNPMQLINFGGGADDTGSVRVVDGWFNVTSLAAQRYIFEMGGGASRWSLTVAADGTPQCTNNINGHTVQGGAGDIVINTWYHFVCGSNETYYFLYIDGVLKEADPDATHPATGLTGLVVGSDFAGGSDSPVRVDNFYFSSSNYTPSDVEVSYNTGLGCDFRTLPAGGCKAANAVINATILYPEDNEILYGIDLLSLDYDIWINVSRNQSNISCLVNDTRWSVSSNTSTMYYFINTSFINEGQSDIYTQCNGSDPTVNGSDTVTFNIEPHILYGVDYEDYVNHTTEAWARYINYTINYTCPTTSASFINLLINGTINRTVTLSCDGDLDTYNGNYTHTLEDDVNISINFYGNNQANNYTLGDKVFKIDLNEPVITLLNATAVGGFNDQFMNITFRCNDTRYTPLNYSLYKNDTLFFNGSIASGTSITHRTSVLPGLNVINATCGDLLGNVTETLNKFIYHKVMTIIDERTGGLFDLNNVTNLTVYFDDNQTFYSFKDESKTNVNFTVSDSNSLRVEIIYKDATIINRYIDVSIDPYIENLRICANTDETTHYEQIITSATERATSVKSVYSNCIVGQDYTRFVYENALVLKVYTRDTLYYLYTYDDNGNKIYLSSMDGSLSTYYNLDVLEFNQGAYDSIIGDNALGIQKENNLLRLYFRDINNDSIKTTVTVREVNTSTVYFTTDEEAQPNDFQMIFDFTTLGLDNNTLMSAEVVTRKSDGTSETDVKYFTLNGKSGILSNGLAFTIAVLLTIFGLTFTAIRIALGWFGAILMLVSIGILSLAVGSFYITFLMVINTIIFIYIVILLTNQNYAAVA